MASTASTQSVISYVCNNCNKEGIKRCGGCDDAHYCSSECQKRDWESGVHKSVCRSFKKFQDRPTKTTYRALWFPADKKAPKFVWVNVYDQVNQDSPVPNTKPYLQSENFPRMFKIDLAKKKSSDKAQKHYKLCLPDATDSLPINISLATLLTEHEVDRLRGSALLVAYSIFQTNNRAVPSGVDTTNLNALLDWFKCHKIEDYKSLLPRSVRTKIQGVRISCDLDRQRNNGVHFVRVNNLDFKDFETVMPIDVSLMVGYPLLIKVEGDKKQWEKTNESLNTAVEMLHRDLDSRHGPYTRVTQAEAVTHFAMSDTERRLHLRKGLGRLGDTPGIWKYPGTCIAISVDGKPLPPGMVRCLSDFASTYVACRFQAFSHGKQPVPEDKLHEMINQAAFRGYFSAWVNVPDNKGERDQDIAMQKFIYDGNWDLDDIDKASAFDSTGGSIVKVKRGDVTALFL